SNVVASQRTRAILRGRPPRRPHRNERMHRILSRTVPAMSIAATVGMFLVLVMGAAVTNTGSAEGCGRSWPLCHGQFIPELAFTTAVELSHRAVTGVVGLLVIAVAALAWMRQRRRAEIRVLVPAMIGTL